MKYKMYCIFSKPALTDLKGIRGKLASQSGHAFLHTFWDAESRFPEYAKAYRRVCHVVS